MDARRIRRGGGLPVLVWIHGGGFEFGASTFFGCEGDRLAAEGAIVVGMNYRLGVCSAFSRLQSSIAKERPPATLVCKT